MNPLQPDQVEHIMQIFVRHLVTLCLTVKDKFSAEDAPGRNIALPGVLLSVQHRVFFLTAGHSFQTLAVAIANKSFNVLKAFLIDKYTLDKAANFPIPFDFTNSLRYHIDNKTAGLDFGLIHLDEYYIRLLEKGSVLPITERNWASPRRSDYEFYFMLGFPAGFSQGAWANTNDMLLTPTLVRAGNLSPIPSDLISSVGTSFLGKLDDDIDVNIEGMSGGPIFGFITVPQLRYWIVAIQSAWYSQRKIVVGCPIARIGHAINAALS